MTKYYLKNVGNLGYAGITKNKENDSEVKEVYLDNLFSELDNSDGEGHKIYLSKFMKSYKKVVKDRYPKAKVEVVDEFNSDTKISDWL